MYRFRSCYIGSNKCIFAPGFDLAVSTLSSSSHPVFSLNLTLYGWGQKLIPMKKSKKKTEQEEEVAEKAPADDMSDIKQFIRKQRLQYEILKKIAEDLQSNPPKDLEHPKSA